MRVGGKFWATQSGGHEWSQARTASYCFCRNTSASAQDGNPRGISPFCKRDSRIRQRCHRSDNREKFHESKGRFCLATSSLPMFLDVVPAWTDDYIIHNRAVRRVETTSVLPSWVNLYFAIAVKSRIWNVADYIFCHVLMDVISGKENRIWMKAGLL